MKLFCLRHNGKIVASAGYFNKKWKAKMKRTEMGGKEKGYTVSPGPDHPNWKEG